jgi:ABC-type phosphate transport system substrate-binding protein
MEALVLQGDPMPDWPDELEVHVMGVLVDVVATDTTGIGYSVYFYTENQYPNPWVKRLGNECVRPTKSTIATGSFPFVSTTYVVTRSDLDPTSPAAAMRDWLLTDEGTLVVERSGYVPYVP